MRLALIAILLLAAQANASFIPLTWDASPTPGCTYVFYASTNELTQETYRGAEVRFPTGTNIQVEVEGLDPAIWSFCATAVKDGAESHISNVHISEIPFAPGNFRTVFVEYTISLTNEWTTVGAIRLRVP